MSEEIEKQEVAVYNELGEMGLRRQAGHVYEDFIPKLKSLNTRMRVYEEMITDPTIGAILFAIELHIRRTKFKTKTADKDDPEAVEMANFLEDCINNMDHTWQDFLSEVLTMIPYGFSVHELVYKKRDDGRIVWKKLPIRAQNSITEWEFDENTGDIKAVVQRTWNQNKEVRIPKDKILLFRPSATRGNPEGRSALRTCYSSWYFKKKLEVTEAIGIERDLTGYPVIKPSMDTFGTSQLAKSMRKYAETMVTRIRKDEQMGSVLPPGWELELIASPGRGQIDTGQVISRYDLRIAQSMLADIIMLGHGQTGSYALAETKHDLLMHALEAWLDTIMQIFNRHAIPKLMALNGWKDEEKYPKLISEPVSKIDPLKLANTLYRLVGVDLVKSGTELEEYLREFLGLPEVNWEEREEEERQEEEEAERERERQEADELNRPDNITRPAGTDGEYNQDNLGKE